MTSHVTLSTHICSTRESESGFGKQNSH